MGSLVVFYKRKRGMKYTLKPGYHYYAGATIPWFIPNATIVSWLRDKGFVGIKLHKRVEPLPKNVDPKIDSEYIDSWDGWVEAYWIGEKENVLELPTDISWMVRAAPLAKVDIETLKKEESEKINYPVEKGFGIGSVVLLAGVTLFWFLRKK